MKKDIEIIKHMNEDIVDILNFTESQNFKSFSESPLIAHKYHTLNLDIIWAVVSVEIPKLKAFIDEFLRSQK